MPFVYPNPLSLVGKPVVGTGEFRGECAALAQFLVPGLDRVRVAQWKRGARVKDQQSLASGTVIATFDSNGRYIGTEIHAHKPGRAHIDLYVRQSSVGVEIVHQFKGSAIVSGALVRFGGHGAAGHHSGVSASGNTPEDDANNHYVVEL